MTKALCPLGRAIKSALVSVGMSRVDCAARLGISRVHLSLLMHGRRDPSWGVVCRLARLLDLDLNAVVKAGEE